MRKVTIGTIVSSNLRQRRSQNRVLFIGITLAVFFLSVCVLGTGCLLASYERHYRDTYGEADWRFLNSEGAELASLFPEGFRMRATEQRLLFAAVGKNERESFAAASYDGDAVRVLHARLTEGRWPERPGEIAVEPAALWRMRAEAKVGDSITLTLAGWDGEKTMAATEERAFTITGLVANQATLDAFQPEGDPLAAALACAWVSAEEPLVVGSRPVINTFVQAVGWPSRLMALRDFFAPYAEQIAVRWSADRTVGDALRLNGEILEFVLMNRGVLLGIAAIALALVGASMAGVAAAVSANADKRRAQVGMLRAIGATQTQLRRILRRETLGLGLATLPLGVGGALLVLWALCRILPAAVFSAPPLLVGAVTGMSALFLTAASARPIRKAACVSPMQALRDVEMLRRQKVTHTRSRKRFLPEALLAARDLSFHRGRSVAIMALVLTGTLLVAAFSFFGATFLQNLANTIPYDYVISLGWGREMDYGNWDFGNRRLSALDKRDIQNTPLVGNVATLQEGVVNILLDEPSAYITGDGWDPDFSRYFPEGPAYARYVLDMGGRLWAEDLAGEWPEHEKYRLFRERFGIDRELLPVRLIAVDDQSLAQMEGSVYDGRIDIEAINAGREVVVAAPQSYFEHMTFSVDPGAGAFSYGYGYGRSSTDESYAQRYMQEGMPEEKIIHENDTFFAGERIDLAWFMSWEAKGRDGQYPEDVTRRDASPLIGAVSRKGPDGFTGDVTVVTTEQGLAALGLDANYTRFEITLAGEPDAQTRAAISERLSAIAARADGAWLGDEYERARSDRALWSAILSAFAVGAVLVFAFTVALINSAVSGRILSEERQIGTMRAVGASRRVIVRSYTRQITRLIAVGGGVGWAAYLAVAACASGLSQWPIGPLLSALTALPAVFLALLWGVCALSVRARLRPIFRKPVVENIRIL